MRYSVCASAVYNGIPLPEAIREIASLDYSAYEFWSWWDQDMDQVAEAQQETGLQPVGLCTRMVPLNMPERRNEYVQGLQDSIRIARRLGCPMLITQVGQMLSDHSRSAQHASIVEGLKVCAPILESEGIMLTVEPLNTLIDHKGYYLDRSDEAFEIIREVNSPNVKVLFDVYHQQVTEGNLIANLTANIDWIGHVHIAGNPGRHEPLTGSEVHYPTIIQTLKDIGYTGAVGLEYFPTVDPKEGLRDILRNMPL